MPRTEVYQLRLTSEEKGKLAGIAEKNGLSIAQMIRQDYELADRPPSSVEKLPKNMDGLMMVAIGKRTKVVTHDGMAILVKQFRGQGYTKPVAERMAREQLGSDESR